MLRSTSVVLLSLSTLLFSLPSQAQTDTHTYACVVTNMGEFCMKFLRDDAPNTVNNFLNYVNRGAYNETFVHKSSPGYAIDAGGYKLDPLGEAIPEDPPVANEFKVSNTRGTVAMVKLPDQPDSATSQWFVNLADNSATLDLQNGGSTVFAKVVKGMDLVSAIGQLLLVNLAEALDNDAFGSLPVRYKDPDGVNLDDLVQIIEVYTTDDVDEDVDNSEAEKERLYACTANWIADISPREVCMETNMGNMCMDLMPEVASKTVANFLHYVADGDYDGTFIHRSVASEPGVIQGGGILASPLFAAVPADAAVENEYSTPNSRGTVAMAKIGGDPDSATSQWFINTTDNSDSLGADNNGGFSVFARVRDADMGVVDQIAALERYNLTEYSSAFET
ncbi:MAG TPA: peptidylprolyl isomerase, partial [Hyphomicrobiales bacterium]|nr:peptidylprolyl isomerase [Hyphomicrobiales bacterium]